MTETTFPLHPECEATLAADPARVYLWDPSRPVRPATEAEVAEYGRRHTDPAWHGLYRFANYTGHAEMAAPPVAEVVPGLSLGGQPHGCPDEPHLGPCGAEDGDDWPDVPPVTGSGHEVTPAAPEGDAADEDEENPYEGTGWTEAEVDHVLNEQAARTYAAEAAAAEVDAADLPRPGGDLSQSEPRPGQPDATRVIPAVEAHTEMFPAVTDSTEGGAS